MTRLEWFKSQVGKKIFRSKMDCCERCNEGLENGIDVLDESHARYLYEIECEFQQYGIKFMYFETKKQADNFDALVV